MRTSTPNGIIPASAVFNIHGEPGSGYLIETDPRFANFRTWTSSDFMIAQFNLNPSTMLKRIGDGFYEQKLIAEQVMLATGQRFVGDYTSDEQEYVALMTAGAAFGKAHQLNIGTELSAEQMAQLTQDIVWLVSQNVTLADGSTQTVLVPKVYVRVHEGDLKGDGTLIAGRDIKLDLTGNLNNNGATIAGRTIKQITADNINNTGGGRIQGTDVALTARTDLNNLSGVIAGNNSVVLTAGRDLNVRTNTIDTVGLSGVRTSLDNIASVSGGNVTMTAGRDLTIAGASINASGDMVLGANRTVTIGTVQSSVATNLNVSGHINTQSLQNNGSQITAGGNLAIAAARTEAADLNIIGSRVSAGNNLTATGSNVNIVSAVDSAGTDMHTLLKHGTNSLIQTSETNIASQLSAGNNLSIAALGTNGAGNLTVKGSDLTTDKGLITLAATGDINVLEQQLSQRKYTAGTYDGGTLLSTVSNKGSNDLRITQGAGSTISGDSVRIDSGRDVLIQGSSVVGTNDVSIAARNNITIAPSQNTKSQTSAFEEHSSGLFSNGGASITLGVKDLKNSSLDNALTNSGSTVGSLTGNINLTAGNLYTQTGSQLVAPTGNITIAAKKVDIQSATDTGNGSREEHTSQSGLTLAVSNPVLDAMLSIANTAETMDQAKDPRLKALAAATAALSARSAVDALTKDPGAATNVTISLTVGSSKSDSKQTQSSSTSVGSSINAGGNVDIRATGDGANSSLRIVGSDVNAGGNATLKSDGVILLQAAQNTAEQHSKTSSDSAALGVAITPSPSGPAVGFTASASTSKGNSDGKDVYWTNTHVNAGNQVSLTSGADTTLKGAVVSGNQVVTNVAGNLNIESLQDASVYKSKDQNAGGSITFGVGFSGSVNIGSSKVNGDFLSVAEQSGIKSGNDGYQVNVAGNTDLKGGVIASTQSAIDNNKNLLTTASMTQSDLQNRSDFSASGFSIGGSFGKETGQDGGIKKFGGGSNGASFGIGSSSGDSTSITKSGISGGAISITDEAKQVTLTGKDGSQTVAAIDRNVTSATASNGIGKDWDGQSLKDTVTSQMQITAAFGQSASKFAGDYADTQQKAIQKQADDARAAGDTERANALQTEANSWAEKGTYRIGIHTAIGLLTGNLSGAAGAFTSATAMPIIGSAINEMGVPEGVKQGLGMIAATTLGAIVGGGVGAATSLNTEANNRQLHPYETRWIQENAKRYAAAHPGMTDAQAETILAQQAYRQAQDGAAGKWDQPASDFLKQANGMLPADPSCSTCGPGYMFFATQDQKANVNMYANTLTKNGDFYLKNGLNIPTAQQLTSGIKADSDKRDMVSALTKLAGIASGAAALVGLSPTFLTLAMTNPVQATKLGIITVETAAAIQSGAITPSMVAEGAAAKSTQNIANGGSEIRYLSNSTAPEIQKRLTNAVNQIRNETGLPTGGNVGFAEVSIPAISNEQLVMKAYSGYEQSVGSFLPKPSGSVDSWILKPSEATSKYIGGPAAYLRDVDSEFKILETVAQRLGNNKAASGQINLITEKLVCPSCSDVISQFRLRYPNIQLNVFTGTGN